MAEYNLHLSEADCSNCMGRMIFESVLFGQMTKNNSFVAILWARENKYPQQFKLFRSLIIFTGRIAPSGYRHLLQNL